MYTVHQAKTNLSRLIQEAEKGREVVIARGKTPVAKLIALRGPNKRRTPGRFKGIVLRADFCEHLSNDELDSWGFK